VVSGLKVSFFKSKFYGINLDDNLLSVASSFLHCEVGSIPFHFLGFLSNTIIRSPVNIFFEIKVFPIVVSRLKVNFFKSKFMELILMIIFCLLRPLFSLRGGFYPLSLFRNSCWC
jgi:hypothetical protein